MAASTAGKRKLDDANDATAMKKIKVADGSAVAIQSTPVTDRDERASEGQEQRTHEQPLNKKQKGKKRAVPVDDEDGTHHSTNDKNVKQRVRKLAPPRPFPTVPTSVSATGPRSAHSEGKNYICITRKTPLGAYMRRCKDLILKDGYKSLHLSAMGAAIPHLVMLSTSLPSILPHAPEEIHTEIQTGTVEVQDEIIPDDEDEDISYQTRGKSTLMIVIKIGDGVDEVLRTKGRGKGKQKSGATVGGQPKQDKGKQAAPTVVIRAEDVEDMEE